MTDLTQRQLHDRILRSLKETGRRMAKKYKGGAEPDQPAADSARKRMGAEGVRRHKTVPGSRRRS
jgi:hypothetical protein